VLEAELAPHSPVAQRHLYFTRRPRKELEAVQAKDSTHLSISRYLETVWGLKAWIVVSILLMALLAGAYSLTLPNRYQATAQTILLPALVGVGARVEARTVSQETLAQLLRNADTARRVHERILSDRASASKPEGGDASRPSSLMPGEIEALTACSDEDIQALTDGALSAALSAEVSVELRMPTEILYSPIVRVRAVMENPNLARVAANAAARVLVDLHAELLKRHSERSYAAMTQLAAERRKAMDAIDNEMNGVRTTLGNPEVLRREADLWTRAYERALEGAAPPPDVESLRRRIEDLRNRLGNVEDKLESLRLARDTHLSTLSNLYYTQDTAAYSAPVHLGELQMASPAGPSAARVSPDRGRMMVTTATVVFVLWLAGALLLSLVEPSAPPAAQSLPDDAGGFPERSRRSRGGRSRPRHGGPRYEGDSRRPGGNAPGGDSGHSANVPRPVMPTPGVTNIRPE
jgi:hypothetical protein